MNREELKAIDPSLGMLGEFSRLAKGTVGHLHRMRQEVIFTDGVYPAKHKALAAALWGVAARCEPCLKFYIHKARELGASEEEFGEYLAVASVMGGCVGEMWALKAYEALKSGGTAESCCS